MATAAEPKFESKINPLKANAMWSLKEPEPAKLIVGILAANTGCLDAAIKAVSARLGKTDLISDVWPFDQTDYYKEQTGSHILRQFVSIECLIDPSDLAKVKHQTNHLEQELAQKLALPLSRPVNLDPGIIEPSKLVLASTKNYSHRIYIGEKIYAEVTLVFDSGAWRALPYTYPDYRQQHYLDFFDRVRTRLLDQLKDKERTH